MLLGLAIAAGLLLLLFQRGRGAVQLRDLRALTATEVREIRVEREIVYSVQRDGESREGGAWALTVRDEAGVAAYLDGLHTAHAGGEASRKKGERRYTVTLVLADGGSFGQTVRFKPLPDREAWVEGSFHGYALRS